MIIALLVDKKVYHSGDFYIQFETFLLGRLFHFRDFLGVEEDAAEI